MSAEEKEKRGIEEITVPVAGMTCAACVSVIEKTLRGLPGVREATVSLAGGKAAVELDPEACTLHDIERAIEDVGYEVAWSRLQLLVLGMMGAHCEENIGGALKALPGVVSVQTPSSSSTPKRGSPRRRSRRRSAGWATRSRRRARARTPWTASASFARPRSVASS